MQFIKPDINIDFVGKRKIAFSLSIAMIVISIVSLVVHGGPKQGIDFAGGTLIQVKFLAPVSTDTIKAGLETIGLGNSSVQKFGEQHSNEYLIRTDSSVMAEAGFSENVKKALASKTGGDVEIRRMDMVGAQVGQDLQVPVDRSQADARQFLLYTAVEIVGTGMLVRSAQLLQDHLALACHA